MKKKSTKEWPPPDPGVKPEDPIIPWELPEKKDAILDRGDEKKKAPIIPFPSLADLKKMDAIVEKADKEREKTPWPDPEENKPQELPADPEEPEEPEDLQELVIDESQENINARVDGFFNHLKSWFYKTCSISNTTYDRILAGAEHPAECIAVYMHLVRTARWQKTNSVYANNAYIKNGLKLGDKALKRVKSELHDLGLIEYKQNRNEKGQLEGTYIVIKYLPTIKGFSTGGSKSTPPVDTGGSKTAPPVSRPTGEAQQMLKEYNEMLKENNNNKEQAGNEEAASREAVAAVDFQSKKTGPIDFTGSEVLKLCSRTGKTKEFIITRLRLAFDRMESFPEPRVNPKGWMIQAVVDDYDFSIPQSQVRAQFQAETELDLVNEEEAGLEEDRQSIERSDREHRKIRTGILAARKKCLKDPEAQAFFKSANDLMKKPSVDEIIEKERVAKEKEAREKYLNRKLVVDLSV